MNNHFTISETVTGAQSKVKIQKSSSIVSFGQAKVQKHFETNHTSILLKLCGNNLTENFHHSEIWTQLNCFWFYSVLGGDVCIF